MEQQRSTPTPAEPWGAEADAIPLLVANTLSHCRSCWRDALKDDATPSRDLSRQAGATGQMGGGWRDVTSSMVGPRADASPGTKGVQGKSPNKCTAGHTIHISQWPSVDSLVTGHGEAEEDLTYLLMPWGACCYPRAQINNLSLAGPWEPSALGCIFSTLNWEVVNSLSRSRAHGGLLPTWMAGRSQQLQEFSLKSLWKCPFPLPGLSVAITLLGRR